jgi:hypothetical protein
MLRPAGHVHGEERQRRLPRRQRSDFVRAGKVQHRGGDDRDPGDPEYDDVVPLEHAGSPRRFDDERI